MADIENESEELENDDIVTLRSADGKDIDFFEIAGIAHKGEFYAILQPVELLEGMAEDDALVFKVSRNENGDDSFSLEIDDEIINAVFEKYCELLGSIEQENEEG